MSSLPFVFYVTIAVPLSCTVSPLLCLFPVLYHHCCASFLYCITTAVPLSCAVSPFEQINCIKWNIYSINYLHVCIILCIYINIVIMADRWKTVIDWYPEDVCLRFSWNIAMVWPNITPKKTVILVFTTMGTIGFIYIYILLTFPFIWIY
jgi:hypothetical protein